ncbi:MAG: glycosyltransferase, partial [Candidatus Electrothrix sp. AR4]|nr:glycosyltransferase [Candidatus Electrothrix sp. AR4]
MIGNDESKIAATEDAPDTIESVKVLGVQVHLLTERRLHKYIADVVSKNSRSLVLNVNVHCYNMVHRNPWLRDFLNQAEIVFCDGAGVVLGGKILGHCIPERFTPADSIWNLAALAQKEGISFFFLGAKPGIADKAAQKLTDRFPGLKITTHHGYFDKSVDSGENKKIIQQIN